MLVTHPRMRSVIFTLLLSTILCSSDTNPATNLESTKVTQDSLPTTEEKARKVRDELVQARNNLSELEQEWTKYGKQFETLVGILKQYSEEELENNADLIFPNLQAGGDKCKNSKNSQILEEFDKKTKHWLLQVTPEIQESYEQKMKNSSTQITNEGIFERMERYFDMAQKIYESQWATCKAKTNELQSSYMALSETDMNEARAARVAKTKDGMQ